MKKTFEVTGETGTSLVEVHITLEAGTEQKMVQNRITHDEEKRQFWYHSIVGYINKNSVESMRVFSDGELIFEADKMLKKLIGIAEAELKRSRIENIKEKLAAAGFE